MATDAIRHAYRRTWWSLVVRGILAIVIGGLIFSRPLESTAAFALVLAIWILFDGIMEIVMAFEVRDAINHWWLYLLGGLVSVAFGVAALYYYPGLSLAFAVVWLALWFTITGAIAIYAGMMERQAGQSWGWTVLWGIVSILAGVYSFMNPGIALVTIMAFIGAVAIVVGILRLVAAFKLSSAKHAVAAAV